MRAIYRNWLAAAGLGVGAAVTALACADGGYESRWEAEDSTALLSPANDTRANLLLLLADLNGTLVADPVTMRTGIVPIDFPWSIMAERRLPPTKDNGFHYDADSYDGTRCHSNAAGAEAFDAAIKASAVPASERTQLVTARQALKDNCANPTKASVPFTTSPVGRSFGEYLDGARLFYAGDFTGATARFAALAVAPDEWVRDTARYMAARSELNRAQDSALDEYGSLAAPAKRDQTTIAAAGRAFAAYLAAFPHGRYVASARGLQRRIAWLGGDEGSLAADYARQLANPQADTSLIDEVDIKLLPVADASALRDPLLMAVTDLLRMRTTSEYDEKRECCGSPIDRGEIERQRQLFARQPDLFTYLLAREASDGRHQPREVLRLIPDASRQASFSYLQFSRQMLRGFALEAVKDPNARGFWLSLFPGAVQPYQRETVELAIARHDERGGLIARLFAPGSPVDHPVIREILLENGAGQALLRQQASNPAVSAQERDVALYTLLTKELQRRQYRDFIMDSRLVGIRPSTDRNWYGGALSYDPTYQFTLDTPPLGYFAAMGGPKLEGCANLQAAVSSLAQNPGAIRPRLCLAEFIRRVGFDGVASAPQSGLGSAPSPFAGAAFARMKTYRSVINDSAATADDKAFALNRAVRCYEPSGYSACGGPDAEKPERQAWFNRLKREFPKSKWAASLRYYW